MTHRKAFDSFLSSLCLVTLCIAVIPTNYSQATLASVEKNEFILQKMGNPVLSEKLSQQERAFVKNLSGGIYRAPRFYSQLQSIISNFRQTGLIGDDAVLRTYFSSDPNVNASVQSGSNLHEVAISEVKVFYIQLTKGLLDILSQPEKFSEALGNDLVERIKRRSTSILAFILAHELGHVMNGDNEKKRVSTKIIEKLHQSTTFRQKVTSVFSSHPKPWFRIANVSELIDQLQTSQQAKSEMGLSAVPSSKKDHRNETLVPRGDEHASRTSVDVVARLVSSAEYQSVSLRDKVRRLEDLLSTTQAVSPNLVTKEGIVATIEAYFVVLTSASSQAEVDDLIESLNRFEDKLGGRAKEQGVRKISDVRGSFRQIKGAIIARQLDLLKADARIQLPEPTSPQTKLTIHDVERRLAYINELGQIVDKTYVLGELRSLVSNTDDLEVLTKILKFYIDRKFSFKYRFRFTEHTFDKRVSSEFLAKVARQHLHISMDLAQTLDFIAREIPLINGSSGSTIDAIAPTMAEFALELIENPQIKVGAFLDRVINPKTAYDKIFSQAIQTEAPGNALHFTKQREKLKTANVNYSIDIHYLQSGKGANQIRLNQDLSRFFILALGKVTGQALMPSLTKNRYSTDQVIQMLIERPGVSQTFWRAQLASELTPGTKQAGRGPIEFQIKVLKARILLKHLFDEEISHLSTQLKTKRTLSEFLKFLSENGHHSNLWKNINDKMKVREEMMAETQRHSSDQLFKKIGNHFLIQDFDVISEMESSLVKLPEGYDDLSKLGMEVQEILSDRVRQNLLEITSARPYSGQAENRLQSTKSEAIILTTKQVESLTSEQKVTLFRDLLEQDEVQRIKQYGRKVRTELANIKASLAIAVKQRDVSDNSKDQILEMLSKLTNLMEPILAGSGNRIPAEYFQLRRELRTYLDALHFSRSKLFELFNRQSLRNLSGLLDSFHEHPENEKYGRRLSSALESASLIRTFMTPSNQISEQILSGDNQPQLEEFGKLATNLALCVAHFEGIDIENAKPQSLVEYYRAKESPSLQNKTYGDYDPFYLPANSKAYAEFLNFDENSTLGKILKGELDEGVQEYERFEFFSNLALEKWVLILYRFGKTQDPVEAMLSSSLLVTVWNGSQNYKLSTNDANARFVLLTWSKALFLVKNRPDMESLAFLMVTLGQKLGLGGLKEELLSSDISKMFSVYTVKYREIFFNGFIKKLAQFDAWKGQRPTVSTRIKFFINGFIGKVDSLVRILDRVYLAIGNIGYGLLKINPHQMVSIFRPIYYALSKLQIDIYSKNIDADYFGRTDHARVFEEIRKMTPWSLEIDLAINSFVQSPEFKRSLFGIGNREYLLGLVKNIRSLRIRDEAYSYLLENYGDVSVNYLRKVKTGYTLVRAAMAAKALWGQQVIDDLKRSDNFFDRLRIIEIAWENFVAERSQRLGLSKQDATKKLITLKELAEEFKLPVEAEVASVFPEGSRHRDRFLDRATKKKSLSLEHLDAVEKMKSRKLETPYHVASKAMLESMDEWAAVLNPLQKSRLLLFMSGMENELDPEVYRILIKRFFATKHRSEAAKSKGLKLRPLEVRDFVMETHPEERLVAFRALFLRGISGNQEAEKLLVDRLLFSDSEMPEYLREVLKLYLKVLTPTELSTRLMWLIASNKQGVPLKGPELLKLLIEYGGVTEKKMAQLVAGHGFNLPKEYRVILEKFEGDAQNLAKMKFIDLVRSRLSADKFNQILSFDQELGSGSLKVGYLVTLKDGRKLVVMATQEMIAEKTAREFQIARAVIEGIQRNPKLRIDNLNVLEEEMERLIKTEMNFLREAKMMKQHKVSYKSRPWLVRKLSNKVEVSIPQPLEDWSSESLLFEEFVEAKRFSQLRPKSFVGWSQRSIAEASVTEVLNQLLVYMDAPNGVVILDIDPHKANQLGQNSLVGTKKRLVNIDLGQSVLIEPGTVQSLVKVILFIATKRTAEAFQLLEGFVNFKSQEQRTFFWKTFLSNQSNYKDPVEVLTQTLERSEMNGIMLKAEFLYFQKLFVTLVGLKRHINDDYFIVKQVGKIFSLRLLGSPLKFKEEASVLFKSEPLTDRTKAIVSGRPATLPMLDGLRCQDIL
ncbi:MAG: hypothetical protein IPK04_03190 [Bdellovibrionales bacterium]|nr:hypothetical protein [Bdellovibrionales bacterium]